MGQPQHEAFQQTLHRLGYRHQGLLGENSNRPELHALQPTSVWIGGNDFFGGLAQTFVPYGNLLDLDSVAGNMRFSATVARLDRNVALQARN